MAHSTPDVPLLDIRLLDIRLLDIRLLGDPVLRQPTVPVESITPELRDLVASMFATMDAAPGQGLAAPQVGRRERLCVIDSGGLRAALINPVIVRSEGRQQQDDGCLSLPGVYATVQRAARVVVAALDLDGEPMELEATDVLAFCLQHEIDHLEGRLFFDHLSVIKRRAVLVEWERERGDYPDGRWHVGSTRSSASVR